MFFYLALRDSNLHLGSIGVAVSNLKIVILKLKLFIQFIKNYLSNINQKLKLHSKN